MTATQNGWLNEPGRLGQLRAVAALVNAMPYRHVPDFGWSPYLQGDCRTKTMWALTEFREAGWPVDSMERWACDLPDGKRHAVLIINIADADGTVIPTAIDCRYQMPMRKDDLESAGYKDWCFVS